MSMLQPLFLNEVFSVRGTLHRVIHIDAAKGNLYTISLQANNPLPECWDIEKLNSQRLRKQLLVVAAPPQPRPIQTTQKDRLVAATRWTRIQELIQNKHALLMDKGTRNHVILEHARKVDCSDRILLDNLRRYWTGGMTQDALLGEYYHCGRLNTETPSALTVESKSPSGTEVIVFSPPSNKARGRRPSVQDYLPMSLSTELKEKILAIGKRELLKDEATPLRSATDSVLSKLFSLRDEKGEPKRTEDGLGIVLKPLGNRPTRRQLRYLFQKAFPAALLHTHRISKSDFDNNHAPAHGSVLDDTRGAGDVYEIDATLADVWLVSSANRSFILGRPTLYLVIDRLSRLIVGFYVSLQSPSWNEGKQAILSIAGDWKGICNRLGVRYDPAHWPAVGVMPNRLVGDRGEMLSYASDVLCDGLQIPITNPPSKAAQKKCIVEGGFHTTQSMMRVSVAGYEYPKNARKRRGKQYSKDACLTLEEFAAHYLRIVIVHNNTVLTNYALSPELVFDGFEATPINLWNHSVRKSMGTLARQDYSYLKDKLMPREVGKVAVDGIHFKGCIYQIDDPKFRSWLSVASLKGTFEVPVAYQSAYVDEVVVFDPVNSAVRFTAILASESEGLAGMSFEEVAAFTLAKKKLKLKSDEKNLGQRLGLIHDNQTDGAIARAETREEAKGVKHGTRMRLGVPARAAESKQRRHQQARFSDEQGQIVPGMTSLAPSSTQPVSEAVPTEEVLSDEKNEKSSAPSTSAPKPKPPADVQTKLPNADPFADLMSFLPPLQ